MQQKWLYDAVIIGAGHNGLVAACYLGQAGLRVLMLEKNDDIGGATLSKKVFKGIDARLSVYSYLISLLPKKIIDDLGLRLEIRRRAIASYTPHEREGVMRGLLVSNASQEVTRQSFIDLFGDEREYLGYQRLYETVEIFARKVWPTLLSPLLSKAALRQKFKTREECNAWDYLVEKPLAHLIEDYLEDDMLRGTVFTDAKIGIMTYPQDPSLLQNRTFLYHTIGQGTGEWRVPVGGMGALVDALVAKARLLGVEIRTQSEVVKVEHAPGSSEVYYLNEGNLVAVEARHVLFNTSSDIANRCLPGVYAEHQVPGSVFKINMLLKSLPALKDSSVAASEAFTGTLHLNEGYQRMQDSYWNGLSGKLTEALPGEMYCHSLTDPSILSADLQRQGWQTLTLFGLDVPYAWFVQDNAAMRGQIMANYLRSIEHWVDGEIGDCLAKDVDGQPCIEAKTPLDLEKDLGLPQGNIFHGNLAWPFAECAEEAGTWGVETRYKNVLMCGSSARRGGAVSGIPGHNAAMKILEK